MAFWIDDDITEFARPATKKQNKTKQKPQGAQITALRQYDIILFWGCQLLDYILTLQIIFMTL